MKRTPETQLMLSRNLWFMRASGSTLDTVFTVAVKYYMHSSAAFQFTCDMFHNICDKILCTCLAWPMDNPKYGTTIYANSIRSRSCTLPLLGQWTTHSMAQPSMPIASGQDLVHFPYLANGQPTVWHNYLCQ